MTLIFKILKIVILTAIIVYAFMWAFSFNQYDTELGISYSPGYAQYLGLNSNETFDAILSDLHPSTIRLAAPWRIVEPENGVYDFTEIDSMIRKAGASGAKVVLTVGQKVPRWPECFIPSWAAALGRDEKKAMLMKYVEKTIRRYKDNPTIELWQAENEPFINFPFGECDAYERSFVEDEIALIRKLDPSRQIVVTDSGEVSTYQHASSAGDILGTTLYRTVRVSGAWVLRYDWLPPAYYKMRARLWGNDEQHFFVSELQAEPWFEGDIPKDKAALANDKTFNPERFVSNVEYAKKAGASRTYLWGAEWWYFMKTKQGDARYWDVAKDLFKHKSEK